VPVIFSKRYRKYSGYQVLGWLVGHPIFMLVFIHRFLTPGPNLV